MTVASVPFFDAIKDVSAGNRKVPQSDYLESGLLAVVDQGKGLVAGYTDDLGARVRCNGPLIVFGDHTRAFKYIDFPFAVGADGVKLLQARDGFDVKFIYHYLRSLKISSAGYSRHFKFLRETCVPDFPIEEQRRIAMILGHADDIRAKRVRMLALVDALAASVFYEMFGDSAADSSVEEVVTSIRTGPFGSQLLHSEFVSDGVAVLGLDNVVRNEFEWVGRRYITESKYAKLKRYTVQSGDVLISIMGTIGRCVVVPENLPTSINTKHICALTLDQSRVHPQFLRAAFLWHPQSRAHLRRRTTGSIMDGLNMGIIKTMPVPMPSLDRQHEFAASIENIGFQRAAVKRALDVDDELLTALQSSAFRGLL